ncbi:hypothetical protein FOG48_01573 [Hanseniaspora uvarum]|nr:hypothetical protein FOG48_01573 [Hanseniaspora uvarum]
MTLELKPSIKSTFYSLKNIDDGIVTDNIVELTQAYINRIASYLSFSWIDNIKTLHEYLFKFFKPTINKIPRSIADLYMMHNHKEDNLSGFKIASLYKSNIATTQTAQHPNLPDFQLICVDNIPKYKDIPFEHLDYKFDIYKKETNDTEFNNHTYVRYYDYRLNKMQEITRTQFLEKKLAKKKSNSPPAEKVVKNQQKRSPRPKKIHNMIGRSIICKVTPDDNFYLKLSEVNIL